MDQSRAPGRRIINGVARVAVHEIFHYFLPGHPHDMEGVFKDHVGGNVLAHSSFEVSDGTRDALVSDSGQRESRSRYAMTAAT